MATNRQLVPGERSKVDPPTRKPTINQVAHFVHQNLVQYTRPVAVSCWRARVGICDRLPSVMKLITTTLLATDERDPMKVAEGSCSFELENFHKSVSKEVYHQEMGQRVQELLDRRKGNESTIDILRDIYDLSIPPDPPRPKVSGDLKELLASRRKPA